MPRAGITLTKKRASKVIRSGGICSECRLPSQIVWHYRQSSHGEVFICGHCRAELLSELSGRDALDHYHSGGAFETNRRRH